MLNGENCEPDLDIEEEAKMLSSYIQIIDQKKIKIFFERLENCFYDSGKSPQDIRQDCMILMIETRGDILKKFPALKDIIKKQKETFNIIMKNNYLEQIIDEMIDNCRQISEMLPLLSADCNFRRIISYVNNNYNENLRLDSLARLFNYNCAYLGKCFKKNTGKNFHTYLDNLRIDTAKDLLKNTNMKVYEISNLVGYANTDYFYSKFKRYTGKSPLVFRKKPDETDA